MSDEPMPLWQILVSAQDQLHWGSEPEALEDTARVLIGVQPGSAVAERLLGRARYLRARQVQRAGALECALRG
jgi:hypothetical protein